MKRREFIKRSARASLAVAGVGLTGGLAAEEISGASGAGIEFRFAEGTDGGLWQRSRVIREDGHVGEWSVPTLHRVTAA